MLAANDQTKYGDPNGGVRGRTEEAKAVCNPIGGTIVSTNQPPQSSQGLNHQSKSTHGGIHGSSCICSRGAYAAEDGLVRCQWEERPLAYEGSMPQCWGMPGPGRGSGWVGEQGEGRWDRGQCFLEGKPGKGIIVEM